MTGDAAQRSVAAAAAEPRPGSGAAWWRACRPATLPAAAAPVLVGTAVALREGGASPALAALCLLVAVALQVTANLVNDVADHARGVDAADRLGPPRAAQRGWLSPAALRGGALVSASVAVIAGGVLIAAGGWPIALAGALSLLAAIGYSAGPAPLAQLGLGDLAVLVFFGGVGVAGSAFVQTGTLSGLALVCSLPVGALATAILVVNNLRDRESDARAGRRTLVVRFGASAARAVYTGWIVLAFALPVLLWAQGVLSTFALAPLALLPHASALLRGVWRDDRERLNPRLAQTAQLGIAFALLFAIGIAA